MHKLGRRTRFKNRNLWAPRNLLRQTDKGSTAHAHNRKQENIFTIVSQIEIEDKDGTLNLYKIG